MNIIVISLERAKERREKIKSQLSALNIDAIIMDAVDGQELSDQEKNKKLSLQGGYRFGDSFKPGEIACTMSHIKALEIAKENNWPYLIVLEDDVVLAEDFEKRIKFLFRIVPTDWEHIYLSGFPRTNTPQIPLPYNVNFLNIVASPIIDCIPATIIRKEAYSKVINYLSLFETTTDDSYIYMIHQKKNLKSYTYFPFSAYVEDEFTYIWNQKIERVHPSKHYFKSKI